jgi:ABC-2 type transport system permease protein
VIGERTYSARGVPARDRWASIRAALALTKVSLLGKLAYPHDLIDDLLQMLIGVLVERQAWIALYGGREAYAGVALAQALTYQVINAIVLRLFSNWIVWDTNEQIQSGDIVFVISRPMYYGHILLFQFIGDALTKLMTVCLPVFLLVCLVFQPALPSSAVVWLAFGLSLVLGFLLSFFVDYVLSLLGFWTTKLGGLFWAKDSIVMILGGSYLPLWIYPPAWKRLLSFLPFQGISYTPVAIFTGQIGLDQVPRAFGVQILWIIVLAWASRRLYTWAMTRLSTQGG